MEQAVRGGNAVQQERREIDEIVSRKGLGVRGY